MNREKDKAIFVNVIYMIDSACHLVIPDKPYQFTFADIVCLIKFVFEEYFLLFLVSNCPANSYMFPRSFENML